MRATAPNGMLGAAEAALGLQRQVFLCCLTMAMSAALLCGQGREAEIQPLLERAEKSQQRGDFEAAATELRQALQLHPSHAEAHARLGLLYRKLGKVPEAIGALERSMELEPNPRLSVLLGFAYMDAGRHREAISRLAPSFESEEKPSVRSAIGQRLLECYVATGDEENSLTTAQKLRQMFPDDPDVLYLASKVYMNLWNGAFQRMLAKQPGSYQVRLIVADALEAQERFGEAASEYREILKLAPQQPGIRYRLAQMILRSDSSPEADQKALEELRQELVINPADARALGLMGEIHLGRKRLKEASQSFRQALALQPEFVPARVGMAKLLIAEKQWPKALEHLEAARKLAPEDEAVAYNLMLTYRALGRAEEAKRALEAFQQLRQRNQQNRSAVVKGMPAP